MNSEERSGLPEVAASKMHWRNKIKQFKVDEKSGTKYPQVTEGIQ